MGLTSVQIERVAYLVGHHHTFQRIDGLDYQILIEADFIVNAAESAYSKENIANFAETNYAHKQREKDHRRGVWTLDSKRRIFESIFLPILHAKMVNARNSVRIWELLSNKATFFRLTHAKKLKCFKFTLHKQKFIACLAK